MIITPFVKKTLSTVIAPHGITDLIHAQQNKLVLQLCSINIASIVGSTVVDSSILDKLFFLFSAWHFRNDMPANYFVPNFIISGSMLFLLINMNPFFFILYMLLFHVPNHYLMNFKMLNKNPNNSVLIICMFSTISAILGETAIIYNPLVHTIGKGIILSHIIYQELFVYRNHTEPFKFNVDLSDSF